MPHHFSLSQINLSKIEKVRQYPIYKKQKSRRMIVLTA